MHHDSQIAKQAQHYNEVRARLMNPKNAVRPGVVNISTEMNKAIEALRSQVAALQADGDAKQAQIEKLMLDLSDAHARLLSQAEKLSMYGEKDEIQENVTEYRRPVSEIIAEVLRDFPDVSWADVQGIRRTRHLITPRHRCMYEVYRQRPDLSLPTIGRVFGGRDHTTILNAVHKIKAERERDAA